MNLSALKILETRLGEAKGNFDGETAMVLATGVFFDDIALREKLFFTLHGSLDAAVALVERVLPHSGIKMELYRNRDNEWNWYAVISSPDEPREGEDPARVFAFQPHPHSALALCLATVRALIAQGEQ